MGKKYMVLPNLKINATIKVPQHTAGVQLLRFSQVTSVPESKTQLSVKSFMLLG